LIAACHADRVLSAFRALVCEQYSGRRLDSLARQHRGRRSRTIHIESGALQCEIDRHGLQGSGERRGVASRNARQRRDRQNPKELGVLHMRLPSPMLRVWAREVSGGARSSLCDQSPNIASAAHRVSLSVRLSVAGVLHRDVEVLGEGVQRDVRRVNGAVVQLTHGRTHRDDIRCAIEVGGNANT
jgi:hypothetical protein